MIERPPVLDYSGREPPAAGGLRLVLWVLASLAFLAVTVFSPAAYVWWLHY